MRTTELDISSKQSRQISRNIGRAAADVAAGTFSTAAGMRGWYPVADDLEHLDLALGREATDRETSAFVHAAIERARELAEKVCG